MRLGKGSSPIKTLNWLYDIKKGKWGFWLQAPSE